MDQQASATLGKAGAVQWRVFVRALADEVDSLAGVAERDDMLRGVGRRMARMAPLPRVDALDALEVEMNDTLEQLGWGSVRLRLHEGERTLFVVHSGLPRIGSLGTPAGHWLAALLEGLYEVWFSQQPGAQASLIARRVQGGSPDTVTLRYARG